MRNKVFGLSTSKAVFLLGLVLVMVIAVGGAASVVGVGFAMTET